jgi:hypothetical protein
MKKIILTIAILAMASNAFATAGMVFASGGTPPTGITFMPSKNVYLGYESGSLGGAGDMVVYGIASKNTAGDRIFGATSSSSAVAQSVSTAGTVLTPAMVPDLPTTSSDSTIAGGADNWSIL